MSEESNLLNRLALRLAAEIAAEQGRSADDVLAEMVAIGEGLELNRLRDENTRLHRANGIAILALRYYAKTAISANAIDALQKMNGMKVFTCFYCSQDHLWLAAQDGWHATKREGIKVRCEVALDGGKGVQGGRK